MLTAGIGTKLARAYATVCPQLAKADVRALTRGSGYDPGGDLGCAVQPATRLQNGQHTPVVKSVILDRAQSGGDRMQFHQLKRRAAFNVNAEC